MLTVILVTAEADLGEGRVKQIVLLSAYETVFILREFKPKFFAVESQNSVKVTLTSINSEGRMRSLK